jgi:hypothetical protein
MNTEPLPARLSGGFLRVWLKLIVPLVVFPALLWVFVIFIEVPLRLFVTASPPGETWVSVLGWAWVIFWSPVALWGAFKICRQLWVRL